MTHSDPDRRRGSGDGAAFRDSGAGSPDGALSAAAQRTLDEIADALGVTAALLDARPGAPGAGRNAGRNADLAEAATLLQAFVGISDPEVRRRCIAFVQAAAERERA